MRPRRVGAAAVTTAELVLWVSEELTCIGYKMGTAWVIERVRHAFRRWILKYIHRHDTAPNEVRNDVTLARVGRVTREIALSKPRELQRQVTAV